MDEVERWLPVPDYEGRYEVSDIGRVRSLWCKGPRRVPKIMNAPLGKGGYPMVMLFRPNSKLKNCAVHRLVLRAFVGEPPESQMDACHWDGDRTNSRLDNLRWDTKSANQRDAVRHGTSHFLKMVGQKHPGAALWDEAVRVIRAEPPGPGVCVMLAKCFDVSLSLIYKIRKGEGWSHVPQYEELG